MLNLSWCYARIPVK